MIGDATKHFVLLSGTQPIGTVGVDRDGDVLHIAHRVDNNGRGASTHETLHLDTQGLPLRWHISGTSLMGGQVDETYERTDGTATWRSRGDEGVSHEQGRLYIADDGSPFAIAIYAEAALAANGRVPTEPQGTPLTVSRVRALEAAGLGMPATVYAVAGLNLTPEIVLLDGGGGLLAATTGTPDMLIAAEAVVPAVEQLVALFQQLRAEHVAALDAQLRIRYEQPVRLRNVRVFDPVAEELSPLSRVTFFRGRITTVEPEGRPLSQDGAVEYDGQGGTVLPGLHDMHAHMHPWAGLLYLAAGVTTVRDMGNHNDVLLDLVRSIENKSLPGPDVVRSGLIEGRSPHSLRMGVLPETLDEALEHVRWYATHGYHQIKLYNSIDPAWIAPLAEEAHALGLRVTGHVPAFATPDGVIADGYDEITHVNQLMLGWLLDKDEDTRTPLRLTAMARAAELDLQSARVQHTVSRMKERGIGLDTTAVILERLMLSRSREALPADRAFLDHTPVSYQRSRKRAYLTVTDDEYARYEKAFAKLLDVIRMLRDEGIALWPGTDDDTGFTVHRELELYVEAGLPAAEVLRRATLECARHLGREAHHGTVTRGKTASFMLVDGDPTSDISAVRNVRLVVKNGDVYEPARIYQLLGITPFVSPAPLVTRDANPPATSHARGTSPST